MQHKKNCVLPLILHQEPKQKLSILVVLQGTRLCYRRISLQARYVPVYARRIRQVYALVMVVWTVARPDTSPMDTYPRTHPRQTVARWTLTRRTVARPESNPTGQ